MRGVQSLSEATPELDDIIELQDTAVDTTALIVLRGLFDISPKQFEPLRQRFFQILLGEPDRLEFASIRKEGVNVVLRFGGTECVALWVDLPGLARYEQDWAFFAPNARATLRFPSPFLRNVPTMLILEEEGVAPAGSRHVEELVSYDEAFRLELLEFRACISEGRPPRTGGADALRDLALCRSIVEAHRTGAAVDAPTAVTDTVPSTDSF